MQANARRALRRAGGACVATARGSPAALHTVGQIMRAQGNRDEFTGAELRMTMRPAGASVEGVVHRPLSTGASGLQRTRAALLHPAQGTGLLQWHVATVLSEVSGARARRATRPSSRVHRSAPLAACAQCAPGTGRKVPTGELRRV